MRDGLMALQCGLALLVLIVAGLFFQSFVETQDTDPGFRVEGLLLATYDLSGTVATDEYARQFATQLLDRLHRVPSVQSVALANAMPLDIHGLPLRGFTLEGRAQTTEQREAALSNIVSPAYFTTMNIPIVAGQDFADMADRTLPLQVIVNEEFVRRYIAPADPIGRRLTSGDQAYTIAGVVKNSTYDAFGEPPTPAFFFSWRDRPRWLGEIHLRARPGSETMLASEVQRAVREIDASLPVYNIRTMAEHIERNLFLRKIPARMFLIIAPLLLILVAIGIYAVVSYTVSQRTTEIGIRIAMGATSNRVVKQIVMEGLIVVSGGLILAWVIAAMVQTHLFSAGPGAWTVLMAVPALLFGVAALACWLPARRATMVDPVVALRAE
jgi:predicted permease